MRNRSTSLMSREGFFDTPPIRRRSEQKQRLSESRLHLLPTLPVPPIVEIRCIVQTAQTVEKACTRLIHAGLLGGCWKVKDPSAHHDRQNLTLHRSPLHPP